MKFRSRRVADPLAQQNFEQLEGLLDEGWHAVGDTGEPAFEGTWVNYDASSAERPARFYKANGRVYLEGVVKSGTVGAGNNVFTLPSGYCPTPASQPIHFAVPSNNAFGLLAIYPTGAVVVIVGSNVWVDLSGASFRCA